MNVILEMNLASGAITSTALIYFTVNNVSYIAVKLLLYSNIRNTCIGNYWTTIVRIKYLC